jgi:hypothetical protein
MPPKKTTRTTRKTYTDSFRIKLGESTHIFTTVEFRMMMMEAVDKMEAVGITHLDPGYLYIKPRDAKGNRITHVLGQQLEDILIPQPYRSAADEHGI